MAINPLKTLTDKQMVSIPAIITGACLYGFLGLAWVMGYNVVKRHSPDFLPRFYMMMAVIRFVLILTTIGVYIFFFAQSHAQVVSFVAMMMVMYAIMMVVTLILKH